MVSPPLCCLCNIGIRGKPVELTPDGKGFCRLPPKCAALATAAGATDSRMLHNERGKWCFKQVDAERKAIREADGVATRGGYDPGESQSRASRTNAEVSNLTIDMVNVDCEAPVGLLLVQEPGASGTSSGSPLQRGGDDTRSGDEQPSRRDLPVAHPASGVGLHSHVHRPTTMAPRSQY